MSPSEILFEEDSFAIFVVANPARPFPHQLRTYQVKMDKVFQYILMILEMKAFHIALLDLGY